VGIDLAKSAFQVHGVDERGNTIVRKQLRRNQMLARSGFVKARTALANQIRGLLAEYRIVLAVGMRQVRVGVTQFRDECARARIRLSNATVRRVLD